MAKKNAITAKAARLLRRAIAHMKKEPLRYDQDVPLVFGTPGTVDRWGRTFPSCGTIGCIAGWVTFLTAPYPNRIKDPIGYAIKKLGFFPQARMGLFGTASDWSDKDWRDYVHAETPEGRVRVAERMVERAIKTGEGAVRARIEG